MPFTPNRPGQQFSGTIALANEVPVKERALAQAIYAQIEQATQTHLLYARIDLIHDECGQLLLMEAEIIEPVLRLEAPGALDRLMQGILNRAPVSRTLFWKWVHRPFALHSEIR
jgi:hypothetical protein